MSKALNSTSPQSYWAINPSDEIGSDIQSRVDTFYNYLVSSSLVELWRRSFYAMYGLFAESATIGFGLFKIGTIIGGGAEGEIARVAVNHYRNLLTHNLSLTTQARPAVKARAVNSDSESLAATWLADGIVDYWMREKHLDRRFRDAVELALIFGESFVRLDWDAQQGNSYGVGPNGNPIFDGDVTCHNYNPFDVVRDTTADNSNDPNWYIVHELKNRYDLAAKHPDSADEILSVSTMTGQARRFVDPTKVIPSAGIGSRQSDLLDIYTFMHKTTAACPNGRMTITLEGGHVLFDGPLPFRNMPIYRISASDLIGAPFGWTTAFDLLGLQELTDKLYTIVSSNQMATGIQNFWLPPGSGLTKTEIAGGLNLLESVVKPEVLQLCATPPEIFNFINKIESIMEMLSGVSAVNRGQTPENLKSGSALAFVAAQAVTFASDLQASYNQLLESVCTGLVEILQDYATTPRLAVIAGQFNRPIMKSYIGKDLGRVQRVVVEATGSTSKTTAGKIQMAQDLLQSGLIRNAREYIAVYNTGELESLMESEMSEILLMRAENEDLRSGKPVRALKIDDHKSHILEHRALLGNPDSRKDLQLVQLVLGHIDEHINLQLQLQEQEPALLAVIGAQPFPQPQPPQPPQPLPPQVNQPGSGAQQAITAQNPTTQAAANVRPSRMPSLPGAADEATRAAYQQMQAQ